MDLYFFMLMLWYNSIKNTYLFKSGYAVNDKHWEKWTGVENKYVFVDLYNDGFDCVDNV